MCSGESVPYRGVRSRSTAFGQVGFEPGQVPTTRKPGSTLDFEFRTKTVKSGGPEKIGLRRPIFRRLHAAPVNRSTLKTPGNLPLSAASGQAESTARMGTGGGGAAACKRSLTNFRPVLICDEDFSSLTQKSNNVAKHNAFCGENGLEIEPFPPVVRRRFSTEG